MYDGFFADFGLPRQLHSDLGKYFESKLFYELCLLAGVNKSHTTAFHPQSDGQTKRMNRTLLQMLKTTTDDNPATWPQRLPTDSAQDDLHDSKYGHAGPGGNDARRVDSPSPGEATSYYGTLCARFEGHSTRRPSAGTRCHPIVGSNAKALL